MQIAASLHLEGKLSNSIDFGNMISVTFNNERFRFHGDLDRACLVVEIMYSKIIINPLVNLTR